ncbi:MAG: cold-shock protein [Roseinatronobacter sp.]
MDSDDTAPPEATGVVKWFDPSKGFGFIVADGYDADVLLHSNALRAYGLSSVCDAARIRITLQKTPRGYQTLEVLAVLPPEPELSEGPGPQSFFVDLALPLEPARVKWFDKVKGFGFANVFGKSEDVFVHMEVLRRSGLAELQAGEAVSLRVTDGERGRMAVSIEPWEAGLAAAMPSGPDV